MKITSMYPICASNDENVENDVKTLIDDGFEQKHKFVDEFGNYGYVLENEAKCKIDVFVNSSLVNVRGLFGTRINVDNLDEAIEHFKTNGFVIESDVFKTDSNRSVFAKSASGAKCYIIEHIK